MQVEFVEGQFDDIEDDEEEENVHEVLSQIMFSKLNTKYKNATQECNGNKFIFFILSFCKPHFSSENQFFFCRECV